MKKKTSLLALFGFVLGLGSSLQGCERGGGEACGDTICGVGQVCCNALEGICTAPGDFCIQ